MAEVVVAAAQAAGDGRGRALALWRAARLGSARPRWMRPPAPARPDQARPSRAVSAICRRRAHEVLRSAASAAPPHPRSPRVRPRTRSLPASLTRPLAHARGISTEPTDSFRPPGPVPPPVQSTSDLLSQISPRNYFPPPAGRGDGRRPPALACPTSPRREHSPPPFLPAPGHVPLNLGLGKRLIMRAVHPAPRAPGNLPPASDTQYPPSSNPQRPARNMLMCSCLAPMPSHSWIPNLLCRCYTRYQHIPPPLIRRRAARRGPTRPHTILVGLPAQDPI